MTKRAFNGVLRNLQERIEEAGREDTQGLIKKDLLLERKK